MLIRTGLSKSLIAKKLQISERHIDRSIKEYYLTETFTSLKKKFILKDISIEDYIVYKKIVFNKNLNEFSETDKSVLERFSCYNSSYYTLLSSKDLSIKEMKRHFILLLASEDLDSTTASKVYGYNDRSSLRYEIFKLFNKITTFTLLKQFSLRKNQKDRKLFRKIEKLVLDYPIRQISEDLGISSWKVNSLIKNYKRGITFSQLRIYLACKKLDSELFNKLKSQECSIDEISVEFANNLLEKGYNISEISKLLYIPITDLNEFFDTIF